MISIIIPALNEEKYLPLLLESIKKQNFSDYEIIVADAGSKDRTLEIARKYNCRIIPGGLPAKGRNEGAKAAKGDLLLFLDADVILPEFFLERSLKELKKRNLQTASFSCVPLCEKALYRFFFDLFYNWPIILFEKISPHAAMGILSEKELFGKLNGFDEKIKVAEDHDFAKRAAKIGRHGILRSIKIFVSDRRFKKEGYLKTAIKYLLCELHLIFLGPVRSDIFHYKFDHYRTEEKRQKG